MRDYLIPLRRPIIKKKKKDNKFWQRCGNTLLVGIQNGTAAMVKSMEVL